MIITLRKLRKRERARSIAEGRVWIKLVNKRKDKKKKKKMKKFNMLRMKRKKKKKKRMMLKN